MEHIRLVYVSGCVFGVINWYECGNEEFSGVDVGKMVSKVTILI